MKDEIYFTTKTTNNMIIIEPCEEEPSIIPKDFSLKDVRTALEKQIPHEVSHIEPSYCKCGFNVSAYSLFIVRCKCCPECGQKLKWSE